MAVIRLITPFVAAATRNEVPAQQRTANVFSIGQARVMRDTPRHLRAGGL